MPDLLICRPELAERVLELCAGQRVRAGVLAACALTAISLAGAAATAVMTQPLASEAQLGEVLVVGKQPGPGLWRVSKGDHDLWIFATLTPCRNR